MPSTASTTYGAVANTIQYLADRSEAPRPTALKIDYNFPLTHAQILDIFRTKLREFKQQHANTQFTDVPPLSPGYTEDPAARRNKIVAVLDSITANPGALMPWQEMVRVAREEGVWTVIDAAHSIGQEVCVLRLDAGFPTLSVDTNPLVAIAQHQLERGEARLLAVQLPQMAVCEARMRRPVHA